MDKETYTKRGALKAIERLFDSCEPKTDHYDMLSDVSYIQNYINGGVSNKETIRAMVDTYGQKQLIVAIEELSELQKELTKDMRGIGNRYDIVSELADVQIMLENIKCYFSIVQSEIDTIIEKKLERTRQLYLKDFERKLP